MGVGQAFQPAIVTIFANRQAGRKCLRITVCGISGVGALREAP